MTYQGWTNWDTWNTFNWLSADEVDYNEARRLAEKGQLQFIATIHYNHLAAVRGMKQDGVDFSKVNWQELEEALLE